MSEAPQPFPFASLAAATERYPFCICDVWGVLHDGTRPFVPAVQALEAYRKAGGRAVLLTNAPMPTADVEVRLRGLNIDPYAVAEAIVTSGRLTQEVIAQTEGAIYHWGPKKDLSLYAGYDVRFAQTPAAADLIIVTGMRTGIAPDRRDIDDLHAARAAEVPMVCANPDLNVRIGGRLEGCAGTLAQLYEELGGRVRRFGKPFAPAYERCVALLGHPPLTQILAIGDGLHTDVPGAAGFGLDNLLITDGVHAGELPTGGASAEEVLRLSLRYGTVPTYFAEYLS